jgi:hypothetical protein
MALHLHTCICKVKARIFSKTYLKANLADDRVIHGVPIEGVCAFITDEVSAREKSDLHRRVEEERASVAEQHYQRQVRLVRKK